MNSKSDTGKTLSKIRDRLPETDEEDLEKAVVLHTSARNNTTENSPEAKPNAISLNSKRSDHQLNWRSSQVWTNFFLVSMLNFISPMGSSILSPAVPIIMEDFGSSNTVLETFVVSVYLLGYATGPLLAAPLSELYGRVLVYHASNIGFICFTIGLSPNLEALIVFRFLAGCFGATPVSNGAGTVGDLFPQEKRARAMSLYLLGPLVGPIAGPIIGGFLSESVGWRWCFWTIATISAAVELAMIVFLKETYAPVIHRRDIAKLRNEAGNTNLHFDLDKDPRPAGKALQQALLRHLKLMFMSPMLLLVSFWAALAYGYTYILLTSLAPIYKDVYDIPTDLLGLTYLGIGVGTLIGTLIYSGTADEYIQRKLAFSNEKARLAGRAEGGLQPEHRLFLFPLGAVLLPTGMLLYGWPAQYHVHWFVPIIGTGVLGIALNILIVSSMTYLIDVFKGYAASAIAASTVTRSLAGGFLPMASLPLYNALGLGWGSTLLAFIALALAPSTVLILKYGAYLRNRFEIKDV